MLKIFTLQEANGLLPLLKDHHLRIGVLLSRLQDTREIFEHSSTKNIKKLEQKIIKLENLISDEIASMIRFGVIVRGLFPPHIDFLSIRNNEPIYLCWNGEDGEIKHWHYLDDNSPYRQTIEEKTYFGPYMVH